MRCGTPVLRPGKTLESNPSRLSDLNSSQRFWRGEKANHLEPTSRHDAANPVTCCNDTSNSDGRCLGKYSAHWGSNLTPVDFISETLGGGESLIASALECGRLGLQCGDSHQSILFTRAAIARNQTYRELRRP